MRYALPFFLRTAVRWVSMALLAATTLGAQAQHLPARPTGAGDQNWDSRFTLPGRVTDDVLAVAEAPNGDIIIGGKFANTGDNPAADRIARWDGTAWQAFGPGLNGYVRTLAFAANGDLLVGGDFTDAGGNAAADRIARWDGTAWQALGAGLNNSPYALLIAPNGDVLAGGAFTDAGGNAAADGIARWDGTAWQALGSGVNSTVFALARAANGDVLVGGYFTNAGGNAAADHIARWTGTAWLPLGTGTDDAVMALAVLPTGDVMAGGTFTQAGSVIAEYVARWDGTAWSGFNDGASGPGLGLYGAVNALVALPNGDLLLGGSFVVYDDIANQATPAGYNLVRWNGTSWQTLGVDSYENSVVALAIVANGDLLAGGNFTSLGGKIYANYAARWNGTSWSALVENNGSGLITAPRSITVAPNGDLLAVIDEDDAFTDRVKDYVWRWNGATWTRLGNGFINGGTHLTVTPAGTIIAGSTYSDHVYSNPSLMAYWDGTAWQPMDNGLPSAFAAETYCTALSIAANGDVLGAFGTDFGDGIAALVARWDGTIWTYLDNLDPEGTVYNYLSTVNALAETPTGELLAGGQGKYAGYSSLISWDGTAWQEISPRITGTVNSLAVTAAGNFIVGGDFTDAGGNAAADRIARWDGTAWHPVGSGLGATVKTVAVAANGDIVAGGNFLDAGGNPAADRIARWDGTAWQALGTGLNGTVTHLGLRPDGDVAAVGYFTAVGDGSKVTCHVGIYDVGTGPGPANLTVSTPQTVTGGAYQNITVTGTGTATLAADVTVTGQVTVQAGGRFETAGRVLSGGAGTGFTLAAGATLVIGDAAGISARGATGAVQTAARAFSVGGKYIYTSATAQNTGSGLPARVRQLGIGGAGNVTLTQPVAVRETVWFAGTGNLLNGQHLTLRSDADSTAAVDNSGGGRVIGGATVQRFISPGPATTVGYHHLSSPVVNTTVADLAVAGVFVPKINFAYNALPYVAPPASQMPNVFGFDETRGGPTAAFGTGYYSPASLGAALVSGRGYSVAMRPATVDFVGTLATGDVAVSNLTRTGAGPGAGGKSGWCILGNPYPAPLDWDVVHVPAGLSPTIYVWKSTGGNGGAYRVRQSNGDGTGTGNLPGGLVPMGQGFFAQVTGAGPVSFTFRDAHRVAGYANPGVFRSAPATAATPLLHLTLAAAGASADATDATFVRVLPTATGGATDRTDAIAPARNAGLPTLRTLAATGEELMINALPAAALTAGLTVELLLDVSAAGTYALAAADISGFGGTRAELLDRATGTRYDLTAQPTVAFAVARAGEVRGQFALVFGQRTLSAAAPMAPTVFSLAPNPARESVRLSGSVGTGTARLFDAMGRTVRIWRLESGTADLSLTGLAPGVYVVRVGTAAQRLVVE